MKTQAISIQIPAPCSQKWEEMSNQQGHKFCSSCQKNVIDFTNLDNRSIVKIVMEAKAKGKSVCGRLASQQLKKLNYYLIPSYQLWDWKRAIGVLAISTVFLMNGCTKVVPEKHNAVHKVYGYVVNQDQKPIIGVEVNIEGTTIKTVTDLNGRYELSAIGKFDSAFNRLLIHRNGMVDVLELNFEKVQQDTARIKEMGHVTMGVIMVEIPHNQPKAN